MIGCCPQLASGTSRPNAFAGLQGRVGKMHKEAYCVCHPLPMESCKIVQTPKLRHSRACSFQRPANLRCYSIPRKLVIPCVAALFINSRSSALGKGETVLLIIIFIFIISFV